MRAFIHLPGSDGPLVTMQSQVQRHRRLSQAVTCEQGSDVEKSDGQKKNGGGGCLYESDQRITWTLPPGLTASSMDMVRTSF